VSLEIKPRRLHGGPWTDAYALHIHMLSSTFNDYDEQGRARFDSVRSPVGELLYALKYRNDQTAIVPLVQAAEEFINDIWRISVDSIVPVPPSKMRAFQPVEILAKTLADHLKVPVCNGCLRKVKQTPQLKDITDYNKRRDALSDAFSVDPELTTGKRLLLFDDLYGPGATVAHIAQILKDTGLARDVYLLTLTTK
jgi:competence protein ComFC